MRSCSRLVLLYWLLAFCATNLNLVSTNQWPDEELLTNSTTAEDQSSNKSGNGDWAKLNKTNITADRQLQSDVNSSSSSNSKQSNLDPSSPVCQKLIKSFEGSLRSFSNALVGLNIYRKDYLMQILPPAMLTQFNTTDWRFQSPLGRSYSLQQLQYLATDTVLATSPVPNVAHYFLPGLQRELYSADRNESDLQFHELVCLLSCAWIMQPRLLFLWLPNGTKLAGKNWDHFRRNLTSARWWDSRIILAYRPDLTRPSAENQSSSSLANDPRKILLVKLEALITFGGAALSTNALIVKPLGLLRSHYFVIGQDHRQYGINDGAFLAARGSTFLSIWHLALKHLIKIDISNQADNGKRYELLPGLLCQCLRRLCDIEPWSMSRPSWTEQESKYIYDVGLRWDWRRFNFIVRLWRGIGSGPVDVRLDDADKMMSSAGSTLAELYRFVIFGNNSSAAL